MKKVSRLQAVLETKSDRDLSPGPTPEDKIMVVISYSKLLRLLQEAYINCFTL